MLFFSENPDPVKAIFGIELNSRYSWGLRLSPQLLAGLASNKLITVTKYSVLNMFPYL